MDMQQNDFARDPKKPKNWIMALVIIGGTLLVGGIGALLGGTMKDGYQKPPLFPADWIFPVVWSINYVAIGIAAFLTFLSNYNSKRKRNDFIWYGVHLFFNMLWPLFFFRLDLLIFSNVWLVLNILSSLIVTVRYYKSNLAAGIIFTVYNVWLVYALYLNLGIAILNL